MAVFLAAMGIFGIISHAVYLGAKHLAVRSGRIDMVFNY
jgi:hypothetical protein